ncbi:BQ5605_C012g06903 [Microbotryum silenes-dioicae]|uniref:BQ5605_C012g06903 protein n=1 Tax=Microbotryum silenes-dioicae TaxID=796604 RepID=A0A2X0LW02_9BASI|nr:BQ5605_C012g06903 [Microbotryum silenes-dioicae]
MMAPKARMGPTKSKVRAPKKHTTGEDLMATLAKLETAIEEIQHRNASKLSFEEHYRYAYNLVLHKQGHTLYNSVANLISSHLESQTIERIVPKFPPTLDQSGASSQGNFSAASAAQVFLDAVKDVWDDHMASMSKLRDVFKYMHWVSTELCEHLATSQDKVYTGSSNLPSIWDLGLSLFFHHVILYSTKEKGKGVAAPTASTSRASAARAPPRPRATNDPSTVAFQLMHTLLNVIRIERQGEVVSRHSIHGAIEILCELTDEGAVPLPVVASNGTGSGTPVLSGGSSSANGGRGGPVLGDKDLPNGLSPYRTAWEQAFLGQSADFYREESARSLIENDCPTFLRNISRRLVEERERSIAYLGATTEPLLVALLEKTLISNHLASILDHQASGLATLVQDNRIEELKMIYTLFGRVSGGHAALRISISKWIVDIGKQVNNGLKVIPDEPRAQADEMNEANPNAAKDKAKAKAKEASGAVVNAKTKAALGWVQNVLDLKDKFDRILRDAFAGDKVLEKSIIEAFALFVNDNDSSPEYISLYIDDNLKKGLKGKTEDEVDDVLNKTIALFRYLTEKDRFEKYYNTHLAKRLIASKSVSDDAERNMLAKFKIEAGAAFTQAAEGMMKDVKISEDTLAEFKRYTTRQVDEPPFSLEPIICGSNVWHYNHKEPTCILPQVLRDGIKYYEKFYNQKHSGRKLTFRSDLGNVDVKTKFNARSHELNVSTHGMVILSLFEGLDDDEKLSYSQISSSTGIVATELRRQLQSLACGKHKILLKHPKGREVGDKDEFSFNADFTSPMAKIKVQLVISKVETPEERRDTDDKVEEARNIQCEAAIVRIMKGRKEAQYGEVVQECIKQLEARFKPQPVMIKKAIERLITKEYLERGDNDRKLLRYLSV